MLVRTRRACRADTALLVLKLRTLRQISKVFGIDRRPAVHRGVMVLSDDWPLPDYEPGPQSHLHALGVIAVTFASFQASIEALYLSFSKKHNVPDNLARLYYFNLGEEQKIRAVRAVFDELEARDDIKGAVANLMDYFEWCQNCRNQLLHAERYPASFSKKNVLYLTKRVRKTASEYGHVALGLEEIRDIAEKTRAGVIQCAELSIYVRYGGVSLEKIDPRYLPYAERLPNKLDVPPRLELALWSD